MCLRPSYSSICPIDWYFDAWRSSCFPGAKYNGVCQRPIKFELLTTEKKLELTLQCGFDWPCLDDCDLGINHWDFQHQICPNGLIFDAENHVYRWNRLALSDEELSLLVSIDNNYDDQTFPPAISEKYYPTIYDLAQERGLKWSCISTPNDFFLPSPFEFSFDLFNDCNVHPCPMGYRHTSAGDITCIKAEQISNPREDLSLNIVDAVENILFDKCDNDDMSHYNDNNDDIAINRYMIPDRCYKECHILRQSQTLSFAYLTKPELRRLHAASNTH